MRTPQVCQVRRGFAKLASQVCDRPEAGHLHDFGDAGVTAIHNCSACDRPIEQGGLHQVWISLGVATDVLPLLVSACSWACVAALPDGARDYIPTPHRGGRVDQPASDWD